MIWQIAIIILLVLVVFSIIQRIRVRRNDKALFNDHVPETKNWAKILYFGGKTRSAGRTKLKLSDGRVFDAWGNLDTIGFKQSGGGNLMGNCKRDFTVNNSETIFKDTISIADRKYEIIIDKSNRVLKIIDFEYKTKVANALPEDKVYKENDLFCTRKTISENYNEILFDHETITGEELLVVSVMVMTERLTPGL